jgi:hypothetical protein
MKTEILSPITNYPLPITHRHLGKTFSDSVELLREDRNR